MAKLDALFDALLAQNGSDLHLAVEHPPLGRIRGQLGPLREGALTNAEIRSLLFEIIPDETRARFEQDLDLDFAHAYGDKARFRANYFFKVSGPAAVFRTIPTKIPTLADLGCPDSVRKLAERQSGLVLVTGPTGSGKSTTLAAMIRHINTTRACHVLTIEDPVEFVHIPEKAQITHREVGPDAGTFSAAIRAAGREDPNVVLVGELRGPETMKLALQLASYGVLVFATVHTNSAPATIDRIINSFPFDEQPLRARHARREPRRNRRAAASSNAGWKGARRGARDPHRHERRVGHDSRREDLPDSKRDAGRSELRHADARSGVGASLQSGSDFDGIRHRAPHGQGSGRKEASSLGETGRDAARRGATGRDAARRTRYHWLFSRVSATIG